jgi:non-structural maintenance of chromosomes element 4
MSSQVVHQEELSQRVDKQYYDPDQDEGERRQNKKAMRDLAKLVNDIRPELLQAKDKGLLKVLEKQDDLMKNVKQTSDATIDSRLLVTVADLSYKKVNELTLGDSSTGVDVEDFVSKCIIFMKKGAEAERAREAREIDPSQPPSSTQTQRRRRVHTQTEEDEEGDAMDWDFLGRNAAFLANSRPCLSGFLLGPLSVQKKVRQPTQRRAREAKADQTQALRPLVLEDEDLQDQEDKPLAAQCTAIHKLLGKTAAKGMDAFNKEYQDHMTDDEAQNLMRKHHIADVEGGVPLFDFVVNPKSFGQTVENMFYVSFLIKEGTAGLEFDSQGMPVLRTAEVRSLAERHNLPRNQAVFTLDFDLWQEIIESCGITESIIPHAPEKKYDDGTRDGGMGWHG